MSLSNRILNSSESITLKLNSRAEKLRKDGKKVFNLTAGQLPFKPSQKLIDAISKQLNMLSSYQYSPVPGFSELKEKFMAHTEETKNISLPRDQYSCIVSTGAKQSVFNLLGALVNPGDEVIVMAPYWVSYPEMVKYWDGVPVAVKSSTGAAEPVDIEILEGAINDKTKAIVLNSPGNPSGIYYPKAWVENFVSMIEKYPKVQIISDDIYGLLSYYDPAPIFVYQVNEKLLERTFIVDGISKSMACTGLRIGYTIGPSHIIKGIGKIQGQSTSGANSLIQKALIEYDFSDINDYLKPIKSHLKVNSEIIREKLHKYKLDKSWYQTNSAFYFFWDFSKAPIMNKFKKSEDDTADYALEICEGLINEKGVVVVPGTDFGVPNSCRISLVLEKEIFSEAIDLAFEYVSQS